LVSYLDRTVWIEFRDGVVMDPFTINEPGPVLDDEAGSTGELPIKDPGDRFTGGGVGRLVAHSNWLD